MSWVGWRLEILWHPLQRHRAPPLSSLVVDYRIARDAEQPACKGRTIGTIARQGNQRLDKHLLRQIGRILRVGQAGVQVGIDTMPVAAVERGEGSTILLRRAHQGDVVIEGVDRTPPGHGRIGVHQILLYGRRCDATDRS